MSDHDLLMRLTEAEGACILVAVSAVPLLLLYLEWESCGFKVGWFLPVKRSRHSLEISA